MPFTMNFADYACVGDTIVCEVDGFRFIATVEFDESTAPMEYDQPGWCFDTTSPEHGEENKRLIEAWKNDEWFYCGIVLSVYRGPVCVVGHAASTWGIECNFPDTSDPSMRNRYLMEVANDLLPEARRHADEIIEKWFADLMVERTAQPATKETHP